MEVIVMNNNKQPNKISAGTNAASASNKFGTEFASETDVQAVKQQNAQAEAKKNQQSSQQ
ncbi:gamma-type small acid-soluble spore protein [Bacillus toyonensis]|uniref:Small, acid-soluble spore protein gamma-type n=2 Tax=Bacillus toyonensis TaxID=155322 RepID=A0A2C5KI76_9BACI|nr:gamma-type small acid-soluble spore protein [Bacillus toyonensis]PEJ94858.1 gamma-type small acid-soluble spore protein [Bacillus toyonensis]PEK83487.1 gamma-type small acid-soluble spore protein [Bacillus toyonensis]PEL20196.1 gamma-type small acid-soluble spore protein [Bacillus toyonensis]PEM82486.1 gamma-type small acid-soluble spore protein [Bacillus toyonensis]PEO53634.1 gamma-type small acid-soluble spore protein [Bacillus toyonensis]